MGFKVDTSIYKDGIIVQTVLDDVTPIPTQLMRQVIDTRNEHIHNALIAMGWTPPQKGNNENKPE